jgi:hypothetical protein
MAAPAENKTFKRHFSTALAGAPSPEPLLTDPGGTPSRHWVSSSSRAAARSWRRADLEPVKVDPRHEGRLVSDVLPAMRTQMGARRWEHSSRALRAKLTVVS